MIIILLAHSAKALSDHDFLLALQLFDSRGEFYNCYVEVVSERLDRLCEDVCDKRVIVRIVNEKGKQLVWADLVSGEELARKFVFKNERLFYSYNINNELNDISVVGKLHTDWSSNILSIRLIKNSGGEREYYWCRGVMSRLVERKLER
ncbi:MAG: hypothetical protein AB2809_20000 [Candidatus Thiodiazotropha sp.]